VSEAFRKYPRLENLTGFVSEKASLGEQMRRSIAILIGLYFTVTPSVCQEQNILNNGGFETGLMCYSRGLWSKTGKDFKGDYKFLLSNDAHSGKYSLEINCAGPDCLKAAIISDRIPTTPGQAYKLSLYAKCPAGKSAAVYVPGTQGGDTYRPLTCNDTWAPNQISFTSGPSANNFFFYVYNMDVAWVRVDDVALSLAGPENRKKPQQVVRHPGVRNVKISGQTVQIDGAPYFARGFFDVGYNDLPLAAATGSNAVNSVYLNMAASCFNSQGEEDYLDRAYDLGLNFVPNSATTAGLRAPAVFPQVISTFSHHLANILWYLADEPDQELVPYIYIPPQTLLEEYQAAKPGLSLPIMAAFQHVAWDTPAATRPYLGSVDVWMAEPYGADFGTLTHAIDNFNTLRRQPIWLAQDAIDAKLIVPKAYWAAIRGATGIFYFNWDEFKTDPAKLAAASQAFNELRQLNDVIFAANADSKMTAPAGIGAMARALKGSVYIIAANPKTESVRGRFRVPGLAAGTQVSVLFENRTIAAESGEFTDSFPGISRHTYVLHGLP